MNCIKCDICGEYADTGKEVNLSIWDFNDGHIIQLKEICLSCADELEEKAKEIHNKATINRTHKSL